jgi:hypothetical protein
VCVGVVGLGARVVGADLLGVAVSFLVEVFALAACVGVAVWLVGAAGVDVACWLAGAAGLFAVCVDAEEFVGVGV